MQASTKPALMRSRTSQSHLRRSVLAQATERRVGTIKLGTTRVTIRPQSNMIAVEKSVLDALSTAKGRGASGLSDEQRDIIAEAVEVLEADGGMRSPTLNEDVLDGKWRLLYTSRPGTASPIQNTLTGVEAFSVYQEVQLAPVGETSYTSVFKSVGRTEEERIEPRINNIVDFGPKIGYLKVEAQASTSSRPLEGFTPRKGEGLALFGKSFSYPPAMADMRIDFQFDIAAFYFKFLPFSVPYPVPFRLLGDETKGWIDVTYMSPDGTLRLSRGNKGTLFILQKEISLKERFIRAVEENDDEQVLALISLMAVDNSLKQASSAKEANGKWKLSQARSYQVVDGDAETLQNIAFLGPFARISAMAEAKPDGDMRTGVYIYEATLFARISAMADAKPDGDMRTGVCIYEASLTIGPVRIPLPVPKNKNNPGYIDYLYLDEDIRITRGSIGSLFVHFKDDEADLPV
eukprot:gene14069-20014_t